MKADGQREGPKLIASRAANMNKWPDLRSGRGGLNDRSWVVGELLILADGFIGLAAAG